MSQRRFARFAYEASEEPEPAALKEVARRAAAAPQAFVVEKPTAPRRPSHARSAFLALLTAAALLGYWQAAGLLLAAPATAVAFALLAAAMVFVGLGVWRSNERARARSEEVLALARRAFMPSTGADPLAQFGRRARGEIDALDSAAARALAALKALDGGAARHAAGVEASLKRIETRREEARHAFAQELKELERLGDAMRDQAAAFAATLKQQSESVRGAAGVSMDELAAAQQALTAQCASLSRVCALLAARTEELNEASDKAHGAAGAVDGALGRALGALAESTRLTETSRKSIDTAAKTAVAAARAVRAALKEADLSPPAAKDGSAQEPTTRVWRGLKAPPEAQAASDAALPLDIFRHAGVDLEGALPSAALEEISERARHGRVARRHAVKEAAAAEVARLERHLRRSPSARRTADQFRRNPGFEADNEAGPARARAYLLLDAALD